MSSIRESKYREVIIGVVVTLLVVVTFGLVFTGPQASATEDEQVCGPLTSGKIDTTGSPSSVTITLTAEEIAAGKVITGYCVKAGSANQENGPVYVTLDEPVTTLTITYPGGKDISHYSYTVETETPPPPTPVVFSFDSVVTPPTCESAGTLVQTGFPGVTITVSPAYTGPGTYTVTATLVNPATTTFPDGTTAPKSRTITVSGALGFQSTNPNAPCYVPPTTPPTPVAFAFSDVTPPTCATAGTFVQQQFPGVTITVSPAFTGPGTYTVTATLVSPTTTTFPDGTTAPKSRTITVLGALGYQSTNPQAACYLAPTPPPVTPPVTPPVVTPPVVTPPVVVVPPGTTPGTPTTASTVKPRVSVSSRCTGTTKFVLDNSRSDAKVSFTMKARSAGKVIWTKTVVLQAEAERGFTKLLPNRSLAVITAVGVRDAVRVPYSCPKPPQTTPNTGFRA